MVSYGYIPPWISTLVGCIGGCFGCFDKCLTIQSLKGKSFSEDFWSSSTCDIEYSALMSQRSISSISISSHSLDLSGSTSHPSEFVNHGLRVWDRTRQQWVGVKKSENRKQLRESESSWNAIYESLHGSAKPFPKPIKLSFGSKRAYMDDQDDAKIKLKDLDEAKQGLAQ